MSELSFEKEKQQLLRQKIQRIKKLFPEQINQLIKIGYRFDKVSGNLHKRLSNIRADIYLNLDKQQIAKIRKINRGTNCVLKYNFAASAFYSRDKAQMVIADSIVELENLGFRAEVDWNNSFSYVPLNRTETSKFINEIKMKKTKGIS